jgi:hypothetical protein
VSQPAPDAPVGAVLDLALIGSPGAGKTELLYLLLRTLRARAPELEGAEAREHRALVTAALGGAPPPAGGLSHAIVHLPVRRLLDEVGRTGRLMCYARAGLFRSLALAIVCALAVLFALALWRGAVDLLGAAAALSVLLVGSANGAFAARASWLELGEIEIALWDAPGQSGEPAELYSLFDALVRERRRRGPPWRVHAFAPILVVNPLALGSEPEGPTSRLRSVLPLFAALGGRTPRAMVALSRWSAVEAVCRPDSHRASAVEVRAGGMGGAPPVAVEREVLRRHCLDAEDGREGDLFIHHLRYDAGAARIEQPSAGDPDRSIGLSWCDRLGGLAGEARQSAFRFLALLVDRGAP